MHRAWIVLPLIVFSSSALATTTQVPEPDTIGLLAAGAVAGLVAWIRSRRR